MKMKCCEYSPWVSELYQHEFKAARGAYKRCAFYLAWHRWRGGFQHNPMMSRVIVIKLFFFVTGTENMLECLPMANVFSRVKYLSLMLESTRVEFHLRDTWPCLQTWDCRKGLPGLKFLLTFCSKWWVREKFFIALTPGINIIKTLFLRHEEKIS